MKRWSTPARKEIENPAIDAFLLDVLAVCERHGMALSHEDNHGAFEVVSAEQGMKINARQWLLDAHDCTSIPQQNAKGAAA